MKYAGWLVLAMVLLPATYGLGAEQRGATEANVTYMAGTAVQTGGQSQPVPRGAKGQLITRADKLVFEFKRKGHQGEWQIPYEDITALARGYVSTDTNGALAIQSVSAAATIIAALGNLNVWWRAAIISASAGAVIFFTIPKQNFITVFFDPDPSRAQASRSDMKACAQKSTACFPQGELAIFEIHRRHDYWNTSLVLNAKTGLAFESESAISK